jgi:ribonuclease R
MDLGRICDDCSSTERRGGDNYNYSENTRKITGERTRRTFSIGDTVRVRLDRIDALERKLQFSLAATPSGLRPKSQHL